MTFIHKIRFWPLNCKFWIFLENWFGLIFKSNRWILKLFLSFENYSRYEPSGSGFEKIQRSDLPVCQFEVQGRNSRITAARRALFWANIDFHMKSIRITFKTFYNLYFVNKIIHSDILLFQVTSLSSYILFNLISGNFEIKIIKFEK